MAMASCSQARSLSPAHAAIIARYFDHSRSRKLHLFPREEAQLHAGLPAVLLLSVPAQRRSNPARRVPGRSFRELEGSSPAPRAPQ